MKHILKYAFIKTIPVLCGYLFLGIAFGILLQKAGYSYVWAFFISTFIYAGSAQFVLTGFLGGGTGLISVALMTLSINIRHIFYGISFINKFKKTGKAYPYMIFSLTDETYSLLCSTKIPKEFDEGKTLLAISLLDQIYWVTGSVAGAALGQFLFFNTKGIDFAMTALFLVIFTEQILTVKSKLPAAAGAISGILLLIVFGKDRFILPSLLLSVSIILLCKNRILKSEREREHAS